MVVQKGQCFLWKKKKILENLYKDLKRYLKKKYRNGHLIGNAQLQFCFLPGSALSVPEVKQIWI